MDYDDPDWNETGKCPKCHILPARCDHECPYSADIKNDRDSQCNCCNKCTRECAYDV
jgi:hypothetical protein